MSTNECNKSHKLKHIKVFAMLSNVFSDTSDVNWRKRRKMCDTKNYLGSFKENSGEKIESSSGKIQRKSIKLGGKL